MNTPIRGRRADMSRSRPSAWQQVVTRSRWLAAALVAALVLPLTLIAAPAQAAVTGTVTNAFEWGNQVHFTNHKAENTAIIKLAVDGGGTLETYCIDIDTPTQAGVHYTEDAWSSAGPKTDPKKVLWILQNSYPTVSVAKIAAAAGVPGLSTAEAITGTQAAIWHFSDGIHLDTKNSANGADTIALYNYLTGTANVGIDDEPAKSLSITPESAQGVGGGRVGPFTVSLSAGVAKLSVPADSGVTIYNAASGGSIVSEAKDGDTIYLQFPADADPGSVTLTAVATTEAVAGRVFTRTGDPAKAQKLILAKSTSASATAKATANYKTKPGEVVVTKKIASTSDNDGTAVDFQMTVKAKGRETQTLTVKGGQTSSPIMITDIPANGIEVTVDEPKASLPAGWSNVGITCTVDGNSVKDASSSAGFTTTVKPGERLACEVTNTYTSVTADLKVKKYDTSLSGALLDGAEFQLWADNGDGSFDSKTDSRVGQPQTTVAGIASWQALKEGTYFVQETKAPTGYEISDPDHQKVVITRDQGGKTLTVKFLNERLTSELSVLKTDADTGAALEGAEFTLFQVTDEGDEKVGTCTTDADGACSIKGLGFGTYVWQETGVPAGYVLPEDPRSEPVTIDATNAGSTLAVFQLANSQVRSELTIVKVDATNDAGLAGAEFTVWRDGGDGVFGGDDKLVTSLATEQGGVAKVGDLVFGTYFVQETKAPSGYQLGDPTVHTVVIDADNAGTQIGVTVKNDRLLSTLTIRKVDATSPERVLAGATFQLWSVDANGRLTTSVGQCTTDTTGVCSVSGLGFGSYRWQETAAPAGFVLPTGAAALSEVVTIDASNAGSTIAAVTFADVPVVIDGGGGDVEIDGSTDAGTTDTGTDDGDAVVAGEEESLAHTGAAGSLGIAIAAIMLVALGGVLLMVRRRGLEG